MSTVDSGNLAGHLLTVRQALVEMVDRTSWFDARFFDGLEDMVGVLTEQADRQLPSNAGLARALAVFSERARAAAADPSGWLWFLTELMERHAGDRRGSGRQRREVKRWSDRLHSAVVAGLADLESLKPAMAWLDRVAPEGDRDGPAELDANWIPPAAKLQFWVSARSCSGRSRM